jgi:protein TonB
VTRRIQSAGPDQTTRGAFALERPGDQERRFGTLAGGQALAIPCRAETGAASAWEKQLVVRLNASKRFPHEAMGQSGTAKVVFVLDRSGKLISNELLESSGVKALDLEAVAIVNRAQPFPAPPPEIDDNRLKLIVPLVFAKLPQMSTENLPQMSTEKLPQISTEQLSTEMSKEDAKVNAKLRSICRGC